MATKLPSKKSYIRFGWHLIEGDDKGIIKLNHGDGRKVRIGRTLSIEDKKKIEICYCGLHASPTIPHAEGYHRIDKYTWLCFVAVWGDIQNNSDKFCGRHRIVLKKWKAENIDRPNISYKEAINDGVDFWIRKKRKETGLNMTRSSLPHAVVLLLENNDKNLTESLKDDAILALNNYIYSFFYVNKLHLLSIIEDPICTLHNYPRKIMNGKYKIKSLSEVEKDLEPITKELKRKFLRRLK